jgi:hypothetical protein
VGARFPGVGRRERSLFLHSQPGSTLTAILDWICPEYGWTRVDEVFSPHVQGGADGDNLTS